MLEAMRTRAGKWVIQVLAFFLILSFAVWGIGDIFRGRTAPTDVAEVGGEEITRQELSNEFRRTVDVLRARLGPRFDSTQALQLGLLEQTLDSLIVGRLFALETRRLGLDAGDDLVRSSIAADPAFQGPAGGFDQMAYRQALSSQNLTEAGYVSSLRAAIVRRQLSNALTAGGTVPKKLQDLVYQFRNERRVAEVARLARGGTAGIAEPSEPALAEFHKKNAAQFTAPAYRDITVVYFDPKAMAAEIEPSEKQLREEYDYRLPSLTVPERRQLQQILVQDEALAKRVHESLKQGRKFAEAATEIAKVPAESLALGRLRKSDLPKAIADAAFAVAVNGFSEPVKSALGWHILRVVRIDGGKAPTFEKVRKRISRDLAREQAVDALIGIANKFEDALAGGASLGDAASGVNATLLKIPAIDVRSADPSGKRVAGVPRDSKFPETVFTTPIGTASSLTETRDGGSFMLRVNRETPPALRPLASVRAKAVEAWKRQQRDDEVRKRAEALMAAAKTQGSLSAAAKEKGIEIKTSKPFSRFIQDPGAALPTSLVGEMFKAEPRGIAMAADDKGYAVAELKSIAHPQAADNAEEYKSIGNSLQAAINSDLINQFADALRQRYTVTIDRQAVDTLF